jgi:hypothetical protein
LNARERAEGARRCARIDLVPVLEDPKDLFGGLTDGAEQAAHQQGVAA